VTESVESLGEDLVNAMRSSNGGQLQSVEPDDNAIETYISFKIKHLASKIAGVSSVSRMSDALAQTEVANALEKIERYLEATNEEMDERDALRRSMLSTPSRERRTPAKSSEQAGNHRSPTVSSLIKSGATASEKLGMLHETRRGVEKKRNELVLEKHKLERVYGQTLEELEESRRQQNSVLRSLDTKKLELDALAQENQNLRDTLRKTMSGSETWKQQALNVTKSLQKHVQKLTLENVQLKEEAQLLHATTAEVHRYNQEISTLSEKVQKLESQRDLLMVEKEGQERAASDQLKNSRHANYLLQLEKKESASLRHSLSDMKKKYTLLENAYNEQANELSARTSEMGAEKSILQGQIKRAQLRLEKTERLRSSGLQGLQARLNLMQNMIGGFQSWNSPSETYRGIDFMARQVTQSESAKLYLIDSSSGTLYRPGRLSDEPEERLAIGKGFAGDVALTGQILRLERIESDKRYLTSSVPTTSSNIGTALLCTPLTIQNKGYIGCIQCTKGCSGSTTDQECGGDGYLPEDEVALQQVSLLASLAVQFWEFFSLQKNDFDLETGRLQDLAESLKKSLDENTARVQETFSNGYISVEELDMARAKHNAAYAQVKKHLIAEQSKVQDLHDRHKMVEETMSSVKKELSSTKKQLKNHVELLSKANAKAKTLEQDAEKYQSKIKDMMKDNEKAIAHFENDVDDLHRELDNARHKIKTAELDHSKRNVQEMNAEKFRSNFHKLLKEDSIERIMSTVVSHSREIVDAERASYFAYDEDSDELWSQVAEGVDNIIRIRKDQGMVGACFVKDELINIRNAQSDPRFHTGVDLKTGFVTRGALMAPVHDKNGNIIGVLQVLNKATDKKVFSEQDETLIAEFALHLGVAVDHAQSVHKVGHEYNKLVTQLQQQVQRNAVSMAENEVHLESLKESVRLHQAIIDISMTLVKVKDVEKVFSAITKCARELVCAERATLFLANNEDKILWSKVAEGSSGMIKVPFGKGIVGDSFEHDKSIKVDNARSDPRFDHKSTQKSGFETRSVLCAPVHAGKERKIYGVLQVLNKRGSDNYAFTELDLKHLVEFANQIGSVVQNWMMYFHTVQRMSDQLNATVDSESKMVDLIRFLLEIGGDALDASLQRSGVSIEDIQGMLPQTGFGVEEDEAALKIQGLFRKKKAKDKVNELRESKKMNSGSEFSLLTHHTKKRHEKYKNRKST
jgi:GAF domain-containing protein